MPELDHLKRDLDYVRAAVARGRDDQGAAPIYFLWAFVTGVGFALVDFAPTYAWPFWLIGGLVGGGASVWLGYRDSARKGVRDPALARRQGLHWFASGVAMGLVMLIIALGKLRVADAAPLLLVIAGLSYLLAGVHLNPPLRWVGAVMLLCAAAMIVLPLPYLWTATGVSVSAALIIGGVCALRAARA